MIGRRSERLYGKSFSIIGGNYRAGNLCLALFFGLTSARAMCCFRVARKLKLIAFKMHYGEPRQIFVSGTGRASTVRLSSGITLGMLSTLPKASRSVLLGFPRPPT